MNHGARAPRYASIAFPLILSIAAIAEVMMYAIAQKEQLGFDKAVEECKYRMSRYGVTPNVNQTPTRTYALPIRTHGHRLTLVRVCWRR